MSSTIFTFCSDVVSIGKNQNYAALIVNPENNEMLRVFKASHDTVVVDKIVMHFSVTQGSNILLRYGLFRSLAAPPADFSALGRVPFLETNSMDSTTGKTMTATFTPTGVPGLEWDLKQTAIRSGHPHVILAAYSIAGEIEKGKYIGSAQIEYHVTLSGNGPGY